MRRELDDDELLPNFSGYADLMSTLCLLFIIVTSVLFSQNKEQSDNLNVKLTELENLQKKNVALANDYQILKNKQATVPMNIIIPNELDGRVFFRPGEAIIQPDFYDLLDEYVTQIQQQLAHGKYNFVEIEGHTDIQPISTFKYKDNWDLGAARAIAVVRYFILKGIDPYILSAVSHGEFKPSVEGDDEETFAQNRRIEITLLKK